MSSDLADLVLEEVAEKMERALARARSEFASVRTGRATPALVEKLPVEAYGEMLPLQQLAGFSVPDARTLMITPYDKANMGAIERSIQNSDLGLNPGNDGVSMRLTFPQLTQERRKDLVKVVKGMAEDSRIALRNARREGRKDLDGLQKDNEITEDELHRYADQLDKLTQGQEADIDAALEQKEAELLEV